MDKTSEKTIVKNTLFLYFRMLSIMFVSLYTSRVVLNALGVNDYGLYQTVAGLVVMLSFLNTALSTGSSRFLTFELGKGTTEKLKQTFTTLLFAHIIIAIILLIIGETFGIWFLNNHIVIPDEKKNASFIVFQLSIFTSLLKITQVPYTSIIIAHEKLSIYAYFSIAETILKLIIASVIQIIPAHKLEFYALFIALVQTFNILFYRIFCIKHYEESKFNKNLLNISILKNIGIFSGWSLFSAISIPLTNQGTLILLNNFFSSAIVSARSVALQVNNAANQFISNFRTATNPQIVKRYSSGDLQGSKTLLLESTSFSFYLMLLLALPIYILSEPLLKVWLVIVPEYSSFYLKWSMISSLFSVFDVSFYTALYAKGSLKENALLSPIIGSFQFPILLILFKIGMGPTIIAYSNVIVKFIIGCIIKPILLKKICDYSLKVIFKIIFKCFTVTLFAIPIPLLLTHFINIFAIKGFFLICFICIFFTCLSIFFVGFDKQMRYKMLGFIKHNISNFTKNGDNS